MPFTSFPSTDLRLPALPRLEGCLSLDLVDLGVLLLILSVVVFACFLEVFCESNRAFVP